MKNGLRNEIMNACDEHECSEEFKEALKGFIDEVETKVISIRDLLDINDISDIGRIEDAKTEADDLALSLY